MSNDVNIVTNINNIHQLVAAIGEHIPVLERGVNYTIGDNGDISPIMTDSAAPLSEDELLDWEPNQMYLVKDSENGDFFLVRWDDHQYHIRPQYKDQRETQPFQMYCSSPTSDFQKFDELFDVSAGIVDLNSLGQLFAYFGPPVAVNLILGVLKQRVESLTDMVEDLRAAQAEAESVAVETNRIAREVAEEAEAIRNSVDAEAEAIREEVRQAAEGSKKSSCLPSPLATLVICGCGLLVGYGIRKIFR